MSDNDTAAFDTAMCTSSNSNKLKVIKNTKSVKTIGVFIRFSSEKNRLRFQPGLPVKTSEKAFCLKK